MRSIKDTIAANICDLRKSHNLTQAGLADKLNYSDKSISKWERGESTPDVDALYNLARIFDVDVDYFFDERNIGKNNPLNYKEIRKRSVVLSTQVLIVYTVALVFFLLPFVLNNPFKDSAWISFIWGTAVSMFLAVRYFVRMKSLIGNVICSSLLNWVLLTAVYLTFLVNGINFWMLYLVGIPVQGFILVRNLLKQ